MVIFTTFVFPFPSQLMYTIVFTSPWWFIYKIFGENSLNPKQPPYFIDHTPLLFFVLETWNLLYWLLVVRAMQCPRQWNFVLILSWTFTLYMQKIMHHRSKLKLNNSWKGVQNPLKVGSGRDLFIRNKLLKLYPDIVDIFLDVVFSVIK